MFYVLCSLTQQLDDIINRITHVSFVLILHAFMFHISCQFYNEEILKENKFYFLAFNNRLILPAAPNTYYR